ncbi:uncharacterized protein PHA67_018852 [Liasis olivaceus]
MPEELLIEFFQRGLQPKLLQRMVCRGFPKTFNGWVAMAGEVEEQWCTIEARTRLPPLPGTKKAVPKAKTSVLENSRSQGVCFNCEELGHFATVCPKAKMEQGGKKTERKGPKSSKPGKKESAAVGSETGARVATRGGSKTQKLLAPLSLRQAASLPEKESSSREDSESGEMGSEEEESSD